MSQALPSRRVAVGVSTALVLACTVNLTLARQSAPRFGGAYSALDERRQALVSDWAERFNKTTGQTLEPAPFYDEVLRLSAKTTFEAVTHALMTSQLTDATGAPIGNALSLVERIDSLRGEIPGASGDRQFRMYVRLVPGARATLDRSREFKRGADNTVYHKGYPISYREQGGVPSIQVSIAADGRQADIDVDYRSSSFPAALFNGHLSSANSDVRAGDNAARHSARWSGLNNWWNGFFGVRMAKTPDMPDKTSERSLPTVPRAGQKGIEVMAHDFLQAWLVDRDVMAAMGYVSDRAYSCMAEAAPDPSAFDRGIAPIQLMMNLKAAGDALGRRASLDAVTTGVRLATPALRVVSQPHHARFVLYSVPDDVAAAFDCDNRLTPSSKKPKRVYGHYYGSTFYVAGRADEPVALLWAKESGYWKIVSWRIGIDDGTGPVAAATPEVAPARIKADPDFVQAARRFLDAWLIRKDFDAAFATLAPASYGCYDLERSSGAPASTSAEDAAARLREAIVRVGGVVGTPGTLEELLEAADPVHSAVRVMEHALSRTFSLTSLPNGVGDAMECEARRRGTQPPDPLSLEYGNAFGLTMRFTTLSGDAPVLRLLWRKVDGAWRVTAYQVEIP